MASFGMKWNEKNSMVWDWENLAPSVPNATGNPGNRATRHGSANSSGGTLTSSSELGHGSSKSSISASIDSPSRVGNNLEFNFAAVKRHVKNMGMDGRVDDSGTSPSSMIAFSHGEPITSLKLGKSTYSEIECRGQDVKSSTTSAVTSSSAMAKKPKVSQQNTQSSCCQVEGCKVDLTSAKDYHRKHKVCEVHSKAPKVVVAGLERRFCQQCSRFHGLAEFDQNKRSCRRRLTHHNARRRKPQADAISFSSSRLSTMFYDTSQQTDLFFCQPPFGQARNNAVSSWDNLGSFKYTETKHLSVQPTKTAGPDELHFSTPRMSNSVVAHAVHHHDFHGLMPPFKETDPKVLNQGTVRPFQTSPMIKPSVEASASISSSSGALVPGRALSLLSDGSWGSSSTVIQRPSSHHLHGGPNPMPPPPLGTAAAVPSPLLHPLDPSPGGFWQDDPPQFDGSPQVQAFTHL